LHCCCRTTVHCQQNQFVAQPVDGDQSALSEGRADKAQYIVAKRIFNSDKICRSYSDLNFGVTFLEHSVYMT